MYCYATANVEQGQRSNDERKELQRRFGHWHQPIPQIIDSISPSDVIRTDIVEIAEPLTALHPAGRHQTLPPDRWFADETYVKVARRARVKNRWAAVRRIAVRQ